MKRIGLLLLLCILLYTNLYSQGTGQWNTLFSYENDITDIAQGEGIVYAFADGKLFSYDPEDDTIETYTKTKGSSITNIAYSDKHKCLVIVRIDGDIDLLYSQNNYTNIASLKDAIVNIDKTTNDIYIHGDNAYLSTNFGLFVINLSKEEVETAVMAQYPFYSTCIYNNKLYSVTSNGVKTVDLAANIQDINTWSAISFQSLYSGGVPFNDSQIKQLVDFDGKLVFTVPPQSLYTFDGTQVNDLMAYETPIAIRKSQNKLLITQGTSFTVMSGLNNRASISLGSIVNCIISDSKNSNLYWTGLKDKKLSSIKVNLDTKGFAFEKEDLRPNGPLTNYPFFMRFENKKLLVAGGGADRDNFYYSGQLSDFSSSTWFNYNKADIDSQTGSNSTDFVSFASDPNDPNHIYVCSWMNGLYEFKNRNQYTLYNEKNSDLTNLVPGDSRLRLNGVCFDKNGNVWFQNSGRPANQEGSHIKLIKKGTSTITTVKFSALQGIGGNTRTIHVDQYNNKWAFWYAASPPPIFIFNDNNGVADNSKTKFINSYVDQDGKTLGITDFYCAADDQSGNMWIGTNLGIFVVYNISRVFERDFVMNKIKVPKNDGTNTADILLEGVPIRAIAVDGGNRKWIGTPSGVYVVSANGQETIHHFTKENSIMPSNSVLSLTIDQETGIVYIGTEEGIVSYKGEATVGADNYSNVYAYPNPVEPEYQGAITITGLMSNSLIKITDVKGNLVNEGRSLGGQYIWDGRNKGRDRVDTGVYLVFGSSEDGKEGVVTKIMVITK